MELLSGTRVALRGASLEGRVVMPEPEEVAPDVGMVLVQWDERSSVLWEYVEDLLVD